MSPQLLAAAVHGPAFYFAVVSSVAGLVSAACAVYVVVRDGRRLKTGEARLLGERIQKAQETADRWYESERGSKWIERVNDNTRRIEGCESKLETVATKTDVARIEGSISRVEGSVADVGAGLDRIENLLMRKALDVR